MASLDYRIPHPTYGRMLPTWHKLRAVDAGRDALIAGGARFLPKPTRMDALRYQEYLCRTKWFGATHRTVQAFEGLAFRQPLAITAPTSLAPQLALLTQTGLDLTTLARLVFRETLLMGRYGVLVDYDRAGTRPYWAGYPAEHILNWSTAIVEGRWILTMVALQEWVWVPGPTGIDQIEQERVRVLELIDGIYTQTLYIYNTQGIIQEEQQVVTQREAHPLDFLPFVFFSATDLEPSLQCSALNDLADTNLAYWRHSADHEWALHLSANPTLWITGHDVSQDVKPDGTPQDEVVLGSDQALIFSEKDAKIGMLEYQGHGLNPLKEALAEDKQEMASLGARLLEGLPETPETLGAVRLRQLGDTSVLVALTQTLSTGLTRLLQWHAYWFGASARLDDPKVKATLATSFVTHALDAPSLTALMAAVQAGHISHETFYYNLQQADLTEPGIDFDEEQARIEAATPAMARLFPTRQPGGGVPGARNGTAPAVSQGGP